MANNTERVGFDMPADIIFDVLSRLPVKTLIRFKSVCKTWNALIESHDFVRTHTKKQPNIELEPDFNNLIVIGKGPGNTKKCSLLHFSETSQTLIESGLSYLSCMENCVMVGVCNGLVCVGLSYDSPDLIIFNPTTGQFRKTRESRFSKGEDDLIFLGFCLDANGYDIIRIIFTYDYSTMPGIRAEIYTMCTDTWSESDVKLGKHPCLEHIHGRSDSTREYLDAVVVSGVFYWKADGDGTPYVAYFDKCTNVFDAICAPWVTYAASGWQLHEIKEELALIVYQGCDYFELWVMNEGMDWTKIRTVDLSGYPYCPMTWEGKIRVLGRTSNGKFVLLHWLEDNLRLSLCDPNSEETKCLHKVGFERVEEDIYLSTVSARLYTLSLTPVN